MNSRRGSWLATQAVHIGLYGFFYRTSIRAGNSQEGRAAEDVEVNVRLAASLFLLAYALLCSIVAARSIGGTVVAAVVAENVEPGNEDGSGAGARSDSVLRAMQAGGPFTAHLASDASGHQENPGKSKRGTHNSAGRLEASWTPWDRKPRPGSRSRSRDGPGEEAEGGDPPTSSTRPTDDLEDGDVDTDEQGGEIDSTHFTGWSLQLGPEEDELLEGECSLSDSEVEARAVGEAVAAAARTRAKYLQQGLMTFIRLMLGMMVGWAYNMWGQVVFRQEELEYRYGPALGATVYAMISTALGVCIMVRGADRLDASGTGGGVGAIEDSGEESRFDGDDFGHGGSDHGLGRSGNATRKEEKLKQLELAHAHRMLVLVGGVSLMVGWAWEEAFDLTLEALLGDSTDLGAILAKLSLAVVSTAIVLSRELARYGGRRRSRSVSGDETVMNPVERDGRQEARSLLTPLLRSLPLAAI